MPPITERLDTNAKALRINLDRQMYGAFAEIGGGQEASRWFFRVGGASGTVAKTISAYDRVVSEALYGRADRAVSRERLLEMLNHEYSRMAERLGPVRGADTRFFAFADTVATLNHERDNECHGWMGLRFQHAPGAPTSDIVIHANLRDPDADRQQQALGILGVNLIFAAAYQRGDMREVLASLMDHLSLDRIEVDVADCIGPAWERQEPAEVVAAEMLGLGLARAVTFDEQGHPGQPSFILHKRAILLHRCSLIRDNPEAERMLATGTAMLRAEVPEMAAPPLAILELSLQSALTGDQPDPTRAAARVRGLLGAGHATMVTRWAETHEVARYIRRYSAEPLRVIIGLDIVVQLLREHFYKLVDGGVLEGLGRLLASNVRVYAFSMPAAVFRERLALYKTEPEFCPIPDKPVIALGDLNIAAPAGRLLEYLRDAGWLVEADSSGAPTPR